MESWLSFFELKCSLLLFILLHYSHSGYSMFFISLSLWQTVIILVCLFVCFEYIFTFWLPGLPWWLRGKASTCNTGDQRLIPGSGRSPGEGNSNPLQYSCLKNPMDGGAWEATVHRVAKSRTWLSDFTVTFWQCNVSCSCCIFPVPVLEPVISLGNLCFFYWSIVFETKIWTLRVFFSSRPSQWIELGSTWMYQFSSVAQSCPTLCEPMNRSTPGLPVHHKLPESTQTHVHRVGDAI